MKSSRFLSVRLPALSTLRMISGRAALVGTPLFLMGMLFGLSRSIAISRSLTGFDGSGDFSLLAPRMVLAFIVLIIYICYLFLTYLKPDIVSSKIRTWLSISGAALALVLPFLASVVF